MNVSKADKNKSLNYSTDIDLLYELILRHELKTEYPNHKIVIDVGRGNSITIACTDDALREAFGENF